ncbi:helix-turn-helix domain-containing protein [Bradyrhizobium sp.]|uniref:helix-turn-helix domain-containing protein n=1 Tax=Bradyrhizobium sp. TaxID=376 RepID=UPI003BB2215A
MERKSWPCRKKGKHGGTLGRAAMEVLRTMLFVIKKIDGKLFPSIETLAILCRMSKQTVVTALKVLEQMGFLTVHKRNKRIQTPLGVRLVQDSDAYEFHFPKTGLGALAMAGFVDVLQSLKIRMQVVLHINQAGSEQQQRPKRAWQGRKRTGGGCTSRCRLAMEGGDNMKQIPFEHHIAVLGCDPGVAK